MGGFSRTSPPSAVAACGNACIDGKARDELLVHGARERARALGQVPQSPPSPCQVQARQVGPVAARLERYGAALPGARASRDLNELGDRDGGAVNQPCITRLPLDAAGLNRALGIDPAGPGAITDADLRNDSTGYRAALYRDDTNNRLIMVSRDTQPNSLVDWKTNIDNGQGRDSDQYKAARRLSSKLFKGGQQFDIAGYSKGGGLAQEAGLMSPRSNVYVFNSSGLADASLARTGQSSFGSLVSRTHAFSAQDDFLTYMNNTTDPAQQLTNAQFLRDQLGGSATWSAPSAGLGKMALKYLSPANTDPKSAAFLQQRQSLLGDLDRMIEQRSVGFPPVHAITRETIPNSLGTAGNLTGATDAGPTLGKLAQHQISNVVGTAGKPGAMEKQMDADRAFLRTFRGHCG